MRSRPAGPGARACTPPAVDAAAPSQSTVILVLLLLLVFGPPVHVLAAPGPSPLADLFLRESTELLAERAAQFAAVNSREQLEAWQARVRAALAHTVFHPLPPAVQWQQQGQTEAGPAAAPAPAVTSTRSMDGPVPGSRIELLAFESRPQHHVTAALFLPAAASPAQRVPGMLYAVGHNPYIFRHQANHQNVIFNMVRMGIAVLSFDPLSQGERTQYLPATGPPGRGSELRGCSFDPVNCGKGGQSCTIEHDHAGRMFFLNNITMASVFLHDAARALDLLAARPEIDPARLGMMGCSGGGTVTSFLSALDRRLSLAVAGCYPSTFEDDLQRRQGVEDAEQQMVHGFRLGLNKQDLYIARAPRPTMLVATTRDNVFHHLGVRAALAEVQRAYALLGAADSVAHAEADFAHGWVTANNEKMYAFLAKHFRLPAGLSTREQPFPPVPCNRMLVTQTGRVLTAFPGEVSVFDLIRQATDNNVRQLAARRSADADADRRWRWLLETVPRQAVAASGLRFGGSVADVGNGGGGGAKAAAAAASTSACGTMSCSVHRYTIPGERGCVIGIDIASPRMGEGGGGGGEGQAKRPAVLVVRGLSTQYEPAVAQILGRLWQSGVTTIAVTPCGFADTAADFRNKPPPGLGIEWPRFLGRSAVGVHAGDVLRALAHVREHHPEYAMSGAVVTQHMAAAYLHASMHELTTKEAGGSSVPVRVEVPARAVLCDSVPSFANIARTRLHRTPTFVEVTGALAMYDLPDLMAALLVARPESGFRIVDPLGGDLQPLSAAAAEVELAPAAMAVAEAERADPGRLAVLSTAGGALEVVVADLAAWLKASGKEKDPEDEAGGERPGAVVGRMSIDSSATAPAGVRVDREERAKMEGDAYHEDVRIEARQTSAQPRLTDGGWNIGSTLVIVLAVSLAAMGFFYRRLHSSAR